MDKEIDWPSLPVNFCACIFILSRLQLVRGTVLRVTFYLSTLDCIRWLTHTVIHEVLTPTVEAGEIICTIDRMKIGFVLNTEAEMKVSRQAVPKAHPDFFSSGIFFYYYFSLWHCPVQSKWGGRTGRAQERGISGRLWLTRLRPTNKQLNRLTGDGGTDESCAPEEWLSQNS